MAKSEFKTNPLLTTQNKATQKIRDLQHFGEEGGVVPVIDVASTSTFLNPEDMPRVFRGELEGCYLYSRHSNPTVNMFSAKMAALEGSEAALGLASGMAAISCSLEQLLQNGDHILCHSVVYGGTYALLKNIFPRRGVDVSFENFNSLNEIEDQIRPNTKVLYMETISNPMLSIAPLDEIKEFKKRHPQVTVVVDNTFAPLIVSPIEWGADVVLHSCTKFISGSSDMIAGCVCASREFIQSLIDVNHGSVMLNGPVMDPRVAHELYLRIEHLDLRMRAHSRAALHLAQVCEEHQLRVIYPGLESHKHYQRFKTIHHQDIGQGGMLTLDLKTPERALKLASALQNNKFALYAVSLGFSRTLVSCPSLSTSSEIPEEERNKIELSPGLLRLSMGFTGDLSIMTERFLSALKEAQS